MAVTNYYSVGGELLGEETSSVRQDYATDALGSVTATVTGGAVVENAYRYKPYGEVLNRSGSGSDPKFLWVGKWGYQRSTNTLKYVRTRYYDIQNSSWISADPLGIISDKNFYLYSRKPASTVDPFGLKIIADYPDMTKDIKAISEFLKGTPCGRLIDSLMKDPNVIVRIHPVTTSPGQLMGSNQPNQDRADCDPDQKGKIKYGDVYWDPYAMGVPHAATAPNYISPIFMLCHELGHVELAIRRPATAKTKRATKHEDYDNEDEEYATCTFETPTAQALQCPTRSDHHGYYLITNLTIQQQIDWIKAFRLIQNILGLNTTVPIYGIR